MSIFERFGGWVGKTFNARVDKRFSGTKWSTDSGKLPSPPGGNKLALREEQREDLMKTDFKGFGGNFEGEVKGSALKEAQLNLGVVGAEMQEGVSGTLYGRGNLDVGSISVSNRSGGPVSIKGTDGSFVGASGVGGRASFSGGRVGLVGKAEINVEAPTIAVPLGRRYGELKPLNVKLGSQLEFDAKVMITEAKGREAAFKNKLGEALIIPVTADSKLTTISHVRQAIAGGNIAGYIGGEIKGSKLRITIPYQEKDKEGNVTKEGVYGLVADLGNLSGTLEDGKIIDGSGKGGVGVQTAYTDGVAEVRNKFLDMEANARGFRPRTIVGGLAANGTVKLGLRLNLPHAGLVSERGSTEDLREYNQISRDSSGNVRFGFHPGEEVTLEGMVNAMVYAGFTTSSVKSFTVEELKRMGATREEIETAKNSSVTVRVGGYVIEANSNKGSLFSREE